MEITPVRYYLCWCRGQPGQAQAAGRKGIKARPLSKRRTFCSSAVQAKGFTRSLTYREEEYTIKKGAKIPDLHKGWRGKEGRTKANRWGGARLVLETWPRPPPPSPPGKEGERKKTRSDNIAESSAVFPLWMCWIESIWSELQVKKLHFFSPGNGRGKTWLS